MPSKARPQLRKGSNVSNQTARDVDMIDTSSAAVSSPMKFPPKASPTKMLPPPNPVPTTILGPEMQALEESLKEAALNTGRVFRFYADTRKERIASHAPYPPKSISRALGRSLERYDQICDAIEAQLLHTVSILERDLNAEQARIDAEESASVATRTRSKRPSLSPTTTRVPLPAISPPPPGLEQLPLTESPISTIPPSQFPPPSGASAISIAPRRPSAILSSLHRPSFPLKLDLSPSALSAGNIDPSAIGAPMDVNVDLGLTSLPSPVTLAPKTARALLSDPSIPDIFGVSSSQGVSAGVSDGAGPGEPVSMSGMQTVGAVQEDVIDLTGPEPSRNGTTQLGDSADKPIELDLEGSYDDMDLFGDVQTGNDTPHTANPTIHANDVTATTTDLDVDMDGLFTPQDNQTNTFQLEENSNVGAAPDPGAILSRIGSNNGPTDGSNELSSLLPGDGQPTGHANRITVQASSDSFVELGGSSDTETQFDLSGIDLSSFSGLFDAPGEAGSTGADAGVEMDLMSQLLTINGGEGVNHSGGEASELG